MSCCVVVSCRVVSCRAVSCRVMSRRVVSCRVVSSRVVLSCCVQVRGVSEIKRASRSLTETGLYFCYFFALFLGLVFREVLGRFLVPFWTFLGAKTVLKKGGNSSSIFE